MTETKKKLFVVVSLGLVTLEYKKTQWWGAQLFVVMAMRPATLEPKKNTTSFSFLFPWDLQHWNKKKTRQVPRYHVPRTCNIGTKKHDDEKFSSLSSWPWGLATLKQKNTTMKSWTPHHCVPRAYSTGILKTSRWGAELFIVVCLNDLQHWNKIRWQQGAELLVVVALGTSNT
jgi:hypothetical protein